jgi:hypothetical protein
VNPEKQEDHQQKSMRDNFAQPIFLAFTWGFWENT